MESSSHLNQELSSTHVTLARTDNTCFCMVPYGQAAHSSTHAPVLAWSPDHAKRLWRPSVKFLARSGDRRELCTQETGENDKNSVLAWYPTGRLRTLLPTPLFLHGLLTMPKGCGDLRSNSSHGLETGENYALRRPARAKMIKDVALVLFSSSRVAQSRSCPSSAG